ncbi:MAG: hypothetical protein WDW36_009162 [Sanguina aurantia]
MSRVLPFRAGDDEESWAKGLTPQLWWKHHQALLMSGPAGVSDAVSHLLSQQQSERLHSISVQQTSSQAHPTTTVTSATAHTASSNTHNNIPDNGTTHGTHHNGSSRNGSSRNGSNCRVPEPDPGAGTQTHSSYCRAAGRGSGGRLCAWAPPRAGGAGTYGDTSTRFWTSGPFRTSRQGRAHRRPPPTRTTTIPGAEASQAQAQAQAPPSPLIRPSSRELETGTPPSTTTGEAAAVAAAARYLWLPLLHAKQHRSGLTDALPRALRFVSSHLAAGRRVLITDTTATQNHLT